MTVSITLCKHSLLTLFWKNKGRMGSYCCLYVCISSPPFFF
jgi:hypothetical protein